MNARSTGRSREEGSVLLEAAPEDVLRLAPAELLWLEEEPDFPCVDLWIKLHRATETVTADLEGTDLERFLREEGLDEPAKTMRGPGPLPAMVAAVAEALRLALRPHPEGRLSREVGG